MLKYNQAFHLHCEFKLHCGVHVTLEALDQEKTYAGLLEGIPDAASNDRRIKSALRKAANRGAPGASPYLIAPMRRAFKRTPGDMRRAAEFYEDRTPEWLPMVQCIAVLRGPARDRARDLSLLAVAWFQDEYALPIQDAVFKVMLELDWTQLSCDVDW